MTLTLTLTLIKLGEVTLTPTLTLTLIKLGEVVDQPIIPCPFLPPLGLTLPIVP